VLEQLELLLGLQAIDAELSGLLAADESLPRRISELERQKTEAGAKAEQKERELEELNLKRSKLELDLKSRTAKLEDLDSKRSSIKTNEEFRALLHEIDFVTKEISQTEDVILEILEEAERLSSELEEARKQEAEIRRATDERIETLERERTSLSDAIAIKKDERKRLSYRVEEGMLGRYERILQSKGDFAVAQIVDSACSGCRKRLPPQTLIEIRSGRRLVECDGCGRILVWIRGGSGGQP
jgi:predicted  nucleic acid-binding Zn-ribbon protein